MQHSITTTGLKNEVSKICPLKLVYQLGLKGVMSTELRTVWVFQKAGSSSSWAHQESRTAKKQKF